MAVRYEATQPLKIGGVLSYLPGDTVPEYVALRFRWIASGVVVEAGTLPTPEPPGGVTMLEVDAAIAAHTQDTTPHPVYDDLPSLDLIFENGLV